MRAFGPQHPAEPGRNLESVRPFQRVIYTCYIVAGVQSLVMGSPNAVEFAMGHVVALGWIVLVILCPAMSLLGQGRSKWPSSLWLQLGGDSGVAFITAAYALAVLQATWADRATVGAWLATGIAVCGVMITWSDIQRIAYGARRTQELNSDE